MAVHTIPKSLEHLAPLINHYGYFALFGLLFVEDFGLPVPGETMLIAAAVFAGLGKLSLPIVMLVGFAAAFAGDNVGYAIGNYGEKSILHKYGKYVFLTAEKIEKATTFFEKYGPRVVVIARFVEGLRQLNGILAGVSSMKWRTFALFNAIGAALWVTTWSLVGYYGGDHIDLIERYGSYLAIAAAIAVIGYFGIKYLLKRRHHA